MLGCRTVLPHLPAITGGGLRLGCCVPAAETEHGPIVQLVSQAAVFRARKQQRRAYSVPGCSTDPLKRAVVKICLKRLWCSSCKSQDCAHRKLCRSAMPDEVEQLQYELALSRLAVPQSTLSRQHIMLDTPAAIKRTVAMRRRYGLCASLETATIGLTQPRACDCPVRACYESACVKADASGAPCPPAPSLALPRLGRPLGCRSSQRCRAAPAEVRNAPDAASDGAPLSDPAPAAGPASSPAAAVPPVAPFSTASAAADAAAGAPAFDSLASSLSFACFCGRGFCGCALPWMDAEDPDKDTRFEILEEAAPVGCCCCCCCLVSIGC